MRKEITYQDLVHSASFTARNQLRVPHAYENPSQSIEHSVNVDIDMMEQGTFEAEYETTDSLTTVLKQHGKSLRTLKLDAIRHSLGEPIIDLNHEFAITVSTYGKNSGEEMGFIVPLYWLEDFVKDIFEYDDVMQFLEEYTWDDTLGMDTIAEEDGVLINRLYESRSSYVVCRRQIKRSFTTICDSLKII